MSGHNPSQAVPDPAGESPSAVEWNGSATCQRIEKPAKYAIPSRNWSESDNRCPGERCAGGCKFMRLGANKDIDAVR